MTIEHAHGRAEPAMSERTPPKDGHFAALEGFRFSAARPAVVTIFNKAAAKFVGVDAVRFLP